MSSKGITNTVIHEAQEAKNCIAQIITSLTAELTFLSTVRVREGRRLAKPKDQGLQDLLIRNKFQSTASAYLARAAAFPKQADKADPTDRPKSTAKTTSAPITSREETELSFLLPSTPHSSFSPWSIPQGLQLRASLPTKQTSLSTERAIKKLIAVVVGTLTISAGVLASTQYKQASRLVPHLAPRLEDNQKPTKTLIMRNDSCEKTHNELFTLQKKTLDRLVVENNIIQAKSTNSTLLAKDVQSRVDITRTFGGRDVNTEYLFGLFADLAASANVGMLRVENCFIAVRVEMSDHPMHSVY